MWRLVVLLTGAVTALPTSLFAQDAHALAQQCRAAAFRQVGGGVQTVELIARLQEQCIQQRGVGRAAAAGASSATALHLSRTAIVGKPVRLDYHYSVNPDCTIRGYPEMRVTGQSRLGSLSTRREGDFPTFPPANVRHVCNTTRVGATHLWYVASAPGMDTVSVRVVYPTGNTVTRSYTINVMR